MCGRSPSFSSTVCLFTNGALFFVRLLREPLTVSQVRRLLAVVLPLKVFQVDEVLQLVADM